MGSRPGAIGGSFWDDADDDAAIHRCQILLNTINAGIYQLDSKGQFVAVNDRIVEMTGYSRDELLEKHVSIILAEDEIERLERATTNQLESNSGVAILKLTVRTADGGTIPSEFRVNQLLEEGSYQGTIGIVRELPEKERPATRETTHDLNPSVTTILDEANIGVFILDDERKVVWADENIGQYFGFDPDDIIGVDKQEIVREILMNRVEDPDRFAERLLTTHDDDGSIEEFECHVTPGNHRKERWLEYRGNPIDSGQYAGGRIEVYYDITKRKRSQEELQETEEQFFSLIDNVEEYAIFRLDPDGHVISWNEGAKEIKGYEADEIIGEHFSTFYTEQARAANVPNRNLEQAKESGSVEDEGWRIRKDGSKFWGNVTITSVRDEDGTHHGFLKVTRDMTDRYRREQEIQSELRRILGRISDAFFALDEDFRFTHVNERAEDLLQYSEEELLVSTLWDVFPKNAEVGGIDEAFKTAMDSQESVNLEFYHDALEVWIEANLYPSETGISVYFRDITDRKEYERKLKESNERLEQFAYAASHDLQEPLRMISSYLQMIERRYENDLDQDGREFIEFAVDGADRMRDMIDGLLEYSRVESRGDPLEPVELGVILADVRDNLHVKIEENDAEISADELPCVKGDAGQLRQLFQNLLDNAVEYSGDEAPRVDITAERNNDQWVISVRDEGIGIDPENTDRVFEVFQSLHAQEDHGGTGIGLSICDRIVERHGGEIWVESEPDEGATFSFTLPAVGDADE